MGRLIVFMFLSIFTFASNSAELDSVKVDMQANDSKMISFIQKAYPSFSGDAEVQSCAEKLKARKALSVEATYVMLLFKLYQEKSGQGTGLEKIRWNKKLYKITPYYLSSLKYCNN